MQSSPGLFNFFQFRTLNICDTEANNILQYWQGVSVRKHCGVASMDCLLVCFMVLNVTFNNISVILWRSVLLVEETGGPGENNRPVASH